MNLTGLPAEQLLAFCQESASTDDYCNTPEQEKEWYNRYLARFPALARDNSRPANKTWYEWYAYTDQHYGYAYVTYYRDGTNEEWAVFNDFPGAYARLLARIVPSYNGSVLPPSFHQLDILPNFLQSNPPPVVEGRIVNAGLVRVPIDRLNVPAEIIIKYLANDSQQPAPISSLGLVGTIQYSLSERQFLWLSTQTSFPTYVTTGVVVALAGQTYPEALFSIRPESEEVPAALANQEIARYLAGKATVSATVQRSSP
jgi:hypothetical protein